MIPLIKGYEIHGNARDYALVINKGEKVKKDGKTKYIAYQTVGYYMSVQNCVKACYNDIVRKLVADEKMTLTEAAKRFEEIEQRLEEIIPDCFKQK